MSLATTLVLVTMVAIAAYACGRRGPAPVPTAEAGAAAGTGALADLERRLARLEQASAAAANATAAARPTAGADTPAPLGIDALGDIRAAARRRDKHNARRHYEALASEVARERRLAEYEPRATGTDSSGARVLHLRARPAPERVRRYRADQRA
jgi:hypothetical protein